MQNRNRSSAHEGLVSLSQIEEEVGDLLDSNVVTSDLLGLSHAIFKNRGILNREKSNLVERLKQILDVDGVALVRFESDDGSAAKTHISEIAGFMPNDTELIEQEVGAWLNGKIQGKNFVFCIKDARRQCGQLELTGQRTKLVSIMICPMPIADHASYAVICARKEVDAFSDRDCELLTHVCETLSDDIRQSRAFYSAAYDPASGLIYRQALMDLLQSETTRARRYQSPLSIMMLEMDGLDPVREQPDNALYDSALQNLAHRIRSEVRESDTCARVAENSFVLVQPMTALSAASQTALRLKASFKKFPLLVSETPIKLNASIGVCSLTAEDDAFSLLSKADRAVLGARRSGGDCVVIGDEKT